MMAMDGGDAVTSVEREEVVEASEEFRQRALVASRAQLQINETSLDDTEVKDEDDWEEEYVVLDLDDIFHGAPIPNLAYTLAGLDTSNPILTLDNGLKLIGQYMETVGSVVVYSEKERDVVAETRELPTPADPFAINAVKKPLKRIRGMCKLERKLKFCAMPIDSAPSNNSMLMHSASAQNAGNVSVMDVMPVPHVNERPVEDVLHVNDRPVTEDVLHVNDKSVEVKDMPVADVLHVNDRPVGEDALHVNNRPVEEDALHVNNRPVEEDALHVNNRPVEEDALHVNDRPVEDSLD